MLSTLGKILNAVVAYMVELVAAMAMAMKNVPPGMCRRHSIVITRKILALAVIRQPQQQSGKDIIQQIYESPLRLLTPII